MVVALLVASLGLLGGMVGQFVLLTRRMAEGPDPAPLAAEQPPAVE